MRRERKTLIRSWLVGLAAALLIAGLPVVVSAEPATLDAAKATVKDAAKVEESKQQEWNSREMARSATREISRSERKRAEEALQNLLAAREEAQQAAAAAETARQAADAEQDEEKKKTLAEALVAAEARQAQTQQRLDETLATLRTVAERLVEDSRDADQAARELIVIENTLRDSAATTRAAERVVLKLEAKAAAEAAWRAAQEAEAVAAWEIQLWAGVQKNTANQMVEQSGHAAQIATKMADAETDPERQQALRQFAEEESAIKKEAEQLITEKVAEVDAAVVQIYPLRAAAMGGLTPLAPDAWDYAKARHLLVRAGFGGTPSEVEKLRSMGLYKAVDYLVDFHRQPAAQATLDAMPFLAADPLENKLRNSFIRSQASAPRRSVEGGQFGRVRQWWLKRLVESPRPLQEKLTLFWHGHFATQQSVVQNSYTLYHQNQLFREHAAGNFGGLLYGIVHDPVMIRYLDNNKNVKGHPNENLAREIMELFALGEDQGYTEADIREAARALTGYTYDHNTGQFRLAHDKHDAGEKTIFGKKGNWTGDDLVNLIIEQPSSARFIALRLFEFFAYQEPSSETVDSLAAVLRASNNELAPMLKNLFLSEEFYCAQATGTQIKSPVQLVVGMLRDLGLKQVTDYGALDSVIQEMGQQLFEPPDVKGWRRGRSWISANRVLIRYNSTANLVKNVKQADRSGVDLVGMLEGNGCETTADMVDHLVKTCFVKPLSDEQRQLLIASLDQMPPPSEWADKRDEINGWLQALLVLMISTPEYQMT